MKINLRKMISPVYRNLNKLDSILKEGFGYDNVTMEQLERKNLNEKGFKNVEVNLDQKISHQLDSPHIDSPASWSKSLLPPDFLTSLTSFMIMPCEMALHMS